MPNPVKSISEILGEIDGRLYPRLRRKKNVKAMQAIADLHGMEVALRLNIAPKARTYVHIVGIFTVETDADAPFCSIQPIDNIGDTVKGAYIYFSPEDIVGYDMQWQNEDAFPTLDVRFRS